MLSMWPLIHKDDQIADINPQSEYNIDDIIIFKESDRLIAHRIIYKFPLSNKFITRGDNNREPDKIVAQKQILGKAISINRKGKVIKIESIYKKQSDYYLEELDKFKILANKAKLKYLILKGIPIYLKYTSSYPRHFIYDADILVHPVDIDILLNILTKLSYKISHENKDAKEFSAIKKKNDLFVSLDLHLEPAIAFSQFPYFNKLLPQIEPFTREIWNTSKDHFLNPNHQFIYLLLHALHHSYAGTSRWDMLSRVAQNQSIDPKLCIKLIHDLNIKELVYGPLLFLEKYYGKNNLTSKIIKGISPRFATKLLSYIILIIVKPWSHHHHYANRLELLTCLFILSPLPISKKLKILFYSITSIDFKVFKNWVKSRFA